MSCKETTSYKEWLVLLKEYVEYNKQVPKSNICYKNKMLGSFYSRQKNYIKTILENGKMDDRDELRINQLLQSHELVDEDILMYIKRSCLLTPCIKFKILEEFIKEYNRVPLAGDVCDINDVTFKIGDYFSNGLRNLNKVIKENLPKESIYSDFMSNELIKNYYLKKYVT